jgi:hypothetical protein
VQPNAAPALATWDGARTDRVPIASVALTPGSGSAGATLPADMRAMEGPPLQDGGLELVASRPLPTEAAAGSPLRIGLLWRASVDGPRAKQLRVRLVRASGEMIQETSLALLGGRVSPATLRAGNVVRDEENVVVDARAPAEAVAVEVAVDDSDALRLGTVQLSGRSHVFDASGQPALATFGGSMQLLSASVEHDSGQKTTVHLRWRAEAAMPVAYKVFVHVLDPTGQQVVAQRDAEPQGGKAPTTGWVAGEVIEDADPVDLPVGLKAGEYPIEVGVYDPRSGDRLTLENGDNRLILSMPLLVR